MLMKMNDWNCSVQHLKYPAREWVNNGNKDVKIGKTTLLNHGRSRLAI